MRKFCRYNQEDKGIVERMLERLSNINTTVEDYRNAFFTLGMEMAKIMQSILPDGFQRNTMLSCASEDADWLASGLLDGMDAKQMPVTVFWSERYALKGGDISPIIACYQDKMSSECKNLIIVKSIISSACVVKTQILRLISDLKPDSIYILAPVMLNTAEESLRSEFPDIISNKFCFISLAIDDVRNERNEVEPGVGGMVYPRLGIGVDANDKNKYIPRLVKERLNL